MALFNQPIHIPSSHWSAVHISLPRARIMAPKKRNTSETEEQTELKLIELLNDDNVLAKLRKTVYPKELEGKLDTINAYIVRLHAQLDAKDERIKCLEDKVRVLEENSDHTEQYGRMLNLLMSGLPESHDGENTDEKVMAMINGKLGMTPPVQRHHLQRIHRLGRKTDGEGRPRARPIIVHFCSERLRNEVFRARTKLKNYNAEHIETKIFINDDLTSRRAKLAYDTRQLNISDCWTAYGKVLVKTLTQVANPSKAGILLDKLSDHQPYFMIFNTKRVKEKSPRYVQINNINDTSIANIIHNLTVVDIFSKLDKSPLADVDANYEIIQQEITKAIHDYLPKKTVKCQKYKHKKSKWITQGVIKSIKYRNNLYRTLKMTPHRSPIYANLKTNLSTYNTILKK